MFISASPFRKEASTAQSTWLVACPCSLLQLGVECSHSRMIFFFKKLKSGENSFWNFKQILEVTSDLLY